MWCCSLYCKCEVDGSYFVERSCFPLVLAYKTPSFLELSSIRRRCRDGLLARLAKVLEQLPLVMARPWAADTARWHSENK